MLPRQVIIGIFTKLDNPCLISLSKKVKTQDVYVKTLNKKTK